MTTAGESIGEAAGDDGSMEKKGDRPTASKGNREKRIN
jgi:hypothetical protein